MVLAALAPLVKERCVAVHHFRGEALHKLRAQPMPKAANIKEKLVALLIELGELLARAGAITGGFEINRQTSKGHLRLDRGIFRGLPGKVLVAKPLKPNRTKLKASPWLPVLPTARPFLEWPAKSQ